MDRHARFRRPAIIIALLFAIGISSVAIWRATWRTPIDPIDAAFLATRDAMDELVMAPLDSRNAVNAAVVAMAIENGPQATPEQIEELRRFLEDAIFFYYVSDGPEDYRAWRRKSGCRLRSREEIDAGGWLIAEAAGFLEDAPLRNGAKVTLAGDVESCFDDIWFIARWAQERAHVATKIAHSDSGCLATFNRSTDGRSAFPLLAGSLGDRAWYGGTVMGSRSWFVNDRIEVLFEGECLVATAGIVLEFGDGLRRPVVFLTVWDHQESRWHLHGVIMTNRPSTHWTWAWEM